MQFKQFLSPIGTYWTMKTASDGTSPINALNFDDIRKNKFVSKNLLDFPKKDREAWFNLTYVPLLTWFNNEVDTIYITMTGQNNDRTNENMAYISAVNYGDLNTVMKFLCILPLRHFSITEKWILDGRAGNEVIHVKEAFRQAGFMGKFVVNVDRSAIGGQPIKKENNL